MIGFISGVIVGGIFGYFIASVIFMGGDGK